MGKLPALYSDVVSSSALTLNAPKPLLKMWRYKFTNCWYIYSGFELQKSIGVLCRAFRRTGKSEPESKGSSFHGANSSEQTHAPNYSEAT